MSALRLCLVLERATNLLSKVKMVSTIGSASRASSTPYAGLCNTRTFAYTKDDAVVLSLLRLLLPLNFYFPWKLEHCTLFFGKLSCLTLDFDLILKVRFHPLWSNPNCVWVAWRGNCADTPTYLR